MVHHAYREQPAMKMGWTVENLPGTLLGSRCRFPASGPLSNAFIHLIREEWLIYLWEWNQATNQKKVGSQQRCSPGVEGIDLQPYDWWVGQVVQGGFLGDEDF